MNAIAAVDQYLASAKDAQLDDLKQWLKIPSVSADPKRKDDVAKAAQWVHDKLQNLGLQTELVPTSTHPLVLASTPPVPGKPVVLVYGHYDVQPPDPLDQWITPAFEPAVRDGNIYARGATDDKGQALTHIQSVAAWIKAGQTLPMQIKFLIEGEEEVGSEALGEYLKEHSAKLACDVIVISDNSQYAKGEPAITYGLRGIAYFEVWAHGPKQDLHSGVFGGSVTNPAIALSRLIASLHDANGQVQLPGFYDSVVPLKDSERQRWEALKFDDSRLAKQLGVSELAGEAGYSTLERRWARPTCDVHGLMGGYQGEGGKTIIPACAGAKVSFRLVPNQDPATVAKQFQAFVTAFKQPGIRFEVKDLHGGPGVVIDPDSPYMKAGERAITSAFGKSPVLMREGGSIPIVAEMVRRTGAAVLLLGWGLDDDNAHSPNEKFSVEDYYRGIRASAHLWHELSQVAKS
jgi:acetylornithine deacetylase/succinyl-diaminopimelate desuccinylase-like protein